MNPDTQKIIKAFIRGLKQIVSLLEKILNGEDID